MTTERMDIYTFINKVFTLALRFNFSVTSWGRTKEHNKVVGGVEQSRHLSWCAIDTVLDNPQDEEQFIIEAKRLGFGVVDEGKCIHLQDKWEAGTPA